MSLVWQQWAFLVFAVLEVLCTVGMVGRPNEPVRKPSTAVVGVIIWIVLTSLVFSI